MEFGTVRLFGYKSFGNWEVKCFDFRYPGFCVVGSIYKRVSAICTRSWRLCVFGFLRVGLWLSCGFGFVYRIYIYIYTRPWMCCEGWGAPYIYIYKEKVPLYVIIKDHRNFRKRAHTSAETFETESRSPNRYIISSSTYSTYTYTSYKLTTVQKTLYFKKPNTILKPI